MLLTYLFIGSDLRPATQSSALKDITILHDLRYREGPSKLWTLDLAMPKATNGKPRPLIVVIHGGGWLEGDKSSFASREHGLPGNIVDFAAQGFVAVTINYRLSREARLPGRTGGIANAPFAGCAPTPATTTSIPTTSAFMAIRQAAIWPCCWECQARRKVVKLSVHTQTSRAVCERW